MAKSLTRGPSMKDAENLGDKAGEKNRLKRLSCHTARRFLVFRQRISPWEGPDMETHATHSTTVLRYFKMPTTVEKNTESTRLQGNRLTIFDYLEIN
jgi:hypothetical protein